MKPNNNPKNRRGLLDYQRRQLELSEATAIDARKRKIQSNLEKWAASLPSELKVALPKNLHESTIEKVRKTQLKPPYDKQIIISGSNPKSSTFVSYAIVYALLRSGQVIPSEIKSTSLLDGYNNINGMFTARRWKEYFFDPKAKILLIEGGSKALTLLASRGEDQFWRELLEFTRNNDKLVIITYTMDEEEQGKKVSIPLITSEYELNSRLIKRSVFISLTFDEEEQIENEQAKTY